uniref:Pancreatic triacylglycerol lipase-like n=1 Tax=Dermatophagoides pteronyssinus TaxID=6956 RepID=A0A6P6YHW1_DERPT|nr:pancreatic triacylglycerol lipase-like [Dermatophagoides pteronyssinus]
MATVLRKSLISKRKKNITATTLTTISPSSSTTLVNVIGRCFEPYGCFRITEPFRTIYRPINLIPEPPNAIKIAFYLRTRNNPTLAERLPYSHTNEFLISKYFRPESDLKIIIHGYLESSDEYWVNEMSMALLNHDDLNVISVDWMLGASPPYSQAVANTRLVGAMIAHLIKIIQKSYPNQFPSNRIHIIGHSLGAHVAGYIGEIITNLGHITGLDPAEPYFQYTDPAVRLDPNDAEFVDIIHSDVASIMSGGFGMSQSCGHVDFYPNGGIEQPGCKSQTSIKNVVDYISKEKNIFDG